MDTTEIKQLAQETGFDACGVTTPASLPEAEAHLKAWVREGKHGGMRYLEDYKTRAADFWSRFPDAKSVIVIGVNYFSMHQLETGGQLRGRVARYAWGKDYHRVIRNRIAQLTAAIQNAGCGTVRFESSVDTRPVLERHAAERAGLGFIGKQTQLLSLQFGPWLFLAELVTNLELEPDVPFHGSCGTCRRCIEKCPTGAIEMDGGLDARKCIAYLTIEHKGTIPEWLRPGIGQWVFGCDECLTVCPYTAKQKETQRPELTAEAGFGEWLDFEKLFAIASNRDYDNLFRGTAFLRTNRKQLLRNACVVLGNSRDLRAVPFLRQALTDKSGLVREHADWALKQFGDQFQNNQAVNIADKVSMK